MAGFWEKSEPRRPKSEGNPKSDARKCPAANGLLVPVAFGFLDRASVGQPAVSLSGFGFRASFGFRISDFGFGRVSLGFGPQSNVTEARPAHHAGTACAFYVLRFTFTSPSPPPLCVPRLRPPPARSEIGRASCRERVWIWVAAIGLK